MEERDVYDTIAAYMTGVPVGYSHRGGGRHPIEIAVQLPKSKLAIAAEALSTPVPANALPGERSIVELGDVVSLKQEKASFPVFRHNGRPAEMVLGELAGAFEAPLYGMLAVAEAIRPRTGACCRSPRSFCTASRKTIAGPCSSGTANGRLPG